MRATSITVALFILFGVLTLGCSKSKGGPPVPVKDVQVEASYLSQEYDIYKYVAIPEPVYATSTYMNQLLDYYEKLYSGKGKVKVMVFPDAATAIQAVTERELAELEMENGKVIRRIINVD